MDDNLLLYAYCARLALTFLLAIVTSLVAYFTLKAFFSFKAEGGFSDNGSRLEVNFIFFRARASSIIGISALVSVILAAATFKSIPDLKTADGSSISWKYGKTERINIETQPLVAERPNSDLNTETIVKIFSEAYNKQASRKRTHTAISPGDLNLKVSGEGNSARVTISEQKDHKNVEILYELRQERGKIIFVPTTLKASDSAAGQDP